MKKLKVHTYGDQVLREKAKPVKRFDDALKELAEKMIVTMHKEDGIGLAAPQIGKSVAMFVVDISPIKKEAEPIVFVNPEIIETYGTCPYKEGCLSIPGISAEVFRPEKIRIRYQDLEGKVYEGVAEDILARVIQHEYDHLNGVLFVDYLSDEIKTEYGEILNSLEKKNMKNKKPFRLTIPRLS